MTSRAVFAKRPSSPSKSPTSKKLRGGGENFVDKQSEHGAHSFVGNSRSAPVSKWFLKAQENVGIKCFVSSLALLSGFHGIIKHRFNDFHVHEIDEKGTKVILADLRVKPTLKETVNDKEAVYCAVETVSCAVEQVSPQVSLEQIGAGPKETPEVQGETNNTISLKTDEMVEDFDKIKEICNEEIQSLFDESTLFGATLFEFISVHDPSSLDPSSITSPMMGVKEKRTELHNLIRKINSILQTRSIDSKTNNSNTIDLVMMKTSKRKQKKDQKKGRSSITQPQKMSWAEKGEYCQFTLYKENKDTMEAISLIAKLLRVESKLFTFCGTKDKRGITTQRVSAYRISQERLAGLNKSLRGIRLGDFSYQKERLQLGDSSGNHFSIVIREVETKVADASALLKSCLDSLSTYGFINYFGMQRFGSRQISTHVIGSYLLSEKWEEACMHILGKDEPSPTKSPIPLSKSFVLDFHTAKEYLFSTMDFEGALPKFPRYCTAERSILNSFISQRKQGSTNLNYLQAIQSITRNLRLMYVHAYQSRVWNEMVSLRHEKYGMKLVIGDLVRMKSQESENEVNQVDQVVIGEDQLEDEEIEGVKRRGLYDIKVIENEQDINHFTIHDLVLPLPGHQVTYPSNMEEEYISFMAQDGFNPREMSRKVREISLPGFYRHVYALPTNVDGYTVNYSDKSKTPVDFLVSDLEKLERSESLQKKEKTEGDLTAFILEFSLASSQYATMALREIMKTETSSSYHSALSQSSKDHIKL